MDIQNVLYSRRLKEGRKEGKKELGTSPAKVIWEEYVATPHGREYTCPLCMLLAAQFPL